MASPRSYSHTEAARMEQIITEFFSKSLHIILESRSPCASLRNFSGEQGQSSPASSTSSSSCVRPRDKWFNLALREYPASLENLDLWRQSNLEPVVVDVILAQKPLDLDILNCSPRRELSRNLSGQTRYPYCLSSDRCEASSNAISERIIERWIVKYEIGKAMDTGSCGKRTSSALPSCYKKLVLLLRSLYVTLRLLPAYKIIHDVNPSGNLRAFTLAHKVSTFVEPFSRKQEADMQQFLFAPVDTSCGKLCLSVIYRSSLSDLNSGFSAPMSPTFIPDYVGSPMANRLKRLPSFPASHGSPSVEFSRRHSWSLDRYKASPPSSSLWPSPTHSDPLSLVTNPTLHRFPTINLPPLLLEASGIHKKNRSFDDYSHSPYCTSSGSSSPAFCIPSSAPVDIPMSKLSNRQSLPPSPPIRISRHDKTRQSTGFLQGSTAINKAQQRPKEDAPKKFSIFKLSSNPSQQISCSRSYGKTSLDDFDDAEFSCAFDVDDDSMTDPGSRLESIDRNSSSLDTPRHHPAKSQEAAVGALVQMLKRASPLRQDSSRTLFFNHPDYGSVEPAALDKAKTVADALEELRGYREMLQGLLVDHSDLSTP